LYRRDGIRLVAFGFDAGEELTEHTAASAAVVQVVSGRITFTVDDTTHELGPTAWVGMPPGDAHSLRAVEPSIVLLTLVSA
jgi:quercetin dioxygenase-like cupin family protein